MTSLVHFAKDKMQLLSDSHYKRVTACKLQVSNFMSYNSWFRKSQKNNTTTYKKTEKVIAKSNYFVVCKICSSISRNLVKQRNLHVAQKHFKQQIGSISFYEETTYLIDDLFDGVICRKVTDIHLHNSQPYRKSG